MALGGSPTSWLLDLGLLASWTLRQSISLLLATQFVVFCYGSPSKQADSARVSVLGLGWGRVSSLSPVTTVFCSVLGPDTRPKRFNFLFSRSKWDCFYASSLRSSWVLPGYLFAWPECFLHSHPHQQLEKWDFSFYEKKSPGMGEAGLCPFASTWFRQHACTTEGNAPVSCPVSHPSIFFCEP